MIGKSMSGTKERMNKQIQYLFKIFIYEKSVSSIEKMDSSIYEIQKSSEENKFESLLHTLHLCKLHLDQKFKHIKC